MAVLYQDNFEIWSTMALGTLTGSYNGVSISSNRLFFNAARAGAIISDRFTPQSTYTINTRLNIAGYSTGGWGAPGTTPVNGTPVWNLNDAGGVSVNMQTAFYIRSDGKGKFTRGPTEIGLPTLSDIQADSGVTFYDIEGKVVIGNSGTIELRINGGVEIGPSTVDTQQSSNSTADSVTLCGYNSNDNNINPQILMEHLIIMDGTTSEGNDFIGPVDVDRLSPTGAGNYTAWTPNGAATIWECIDELNPDEATTYASASAVGTKYTVTHPPVATGTTNILSLFFWTRGRRDDAVTRAFKLLLRSSGSDQLGSTEHFLGDDYLWFGDSYPSSPFTSSPWGVTEVNNLEYGSQVTT